MTQSARLLVAIVVFWLLLAAAFWLADQIEHRMRTRLIQRRK